MPQTSRLRCHVWLPPSPSISDDAGRPLPWEGRCVARSPPSDTSPVRGPQKARDACHHLIVAAVDLALRVEDAAPVVALEALLGVDVEEHLHAATLLARLEGLERARRLQLARKRANERRRRAPRAHQLAGLQGEGRAVQRADDRVVLD